MYVFYLRNFRKGYATNSSSTHSIIYRNEDELLNDLNVMDENFYDRCTETIAASKEAKIKYIAANIFYNKKLFDVLCLYYPEMEQYRELAKKQIKKDEEHDYGDDDIFGMYARGGLDFNASENFEASIDYIRFIIDTKDVVIVGGSDEMDFVYDTTEGHKKFPMPDHIDNDFGLWRNGNYWFSNIWGNRARFNIDRVECIPEYPELIDIKVTNMCSNACPFCYMNATPDGKHAEWSKLSALIYQLSSTSYSRYQRRIEFAIGGGNVLDYPNLQQLLELLKEKKHIANITLKACDMLRVCEDEKLTTLFKNYVSGIGISVCDDEDIECITKFGRRFGDGTRIAYPVIHLIPEMLGVEKTREYINKCKSCEFFSFLFLGYKHTGRAANTKAKMLTKEELRELFNNVWNTSIDTTFANRYWEWLDGEFATEHTITRQEGEFSMFIDAVEMNAYCSSYDLSRPYNLIAPEDWQEYKDGIDKTWFSPLSAFNCIRKDNGLPIFEGYNKY